MIRRKQLKERNISSIFEIPVCPSLCSTQKIINYSSYALRSARDELAQHFTDQHYFIHWPSRNHKRLQKKGFTSVVNTPTPACFVPSTFLNFIWFLTYHLILSTIFPWFLTHSFWDLFDLTQPLPPALSVPTCLGFPYPEFSCHLCARPQYDALLGGSEFRSY